MKVLAKKLVKKIRTRNNLPQANLTVRRSYCYKWPTPEQFKEEYGREYPDEGAVWVRTKGETNYFWCITTYEVAKYRGKDTVIVCACTPCGKPADSWIPE